MSNTTKIWIHGLLGATIGAVGSAISNLIVDPATFNFTAAGWEKLGQAAIINAVLAVGLYLKSSPWPPSGS